MIMGVYPLLRRSRQGRATSAAGCSLQKATILSSCRHRSRLCLLQYIDMHGRLGTRWWGCSTARGVATKSSRWLSKVSASWVVNLYRTNRLSSLTLLHFETEILWKKPIIVIWTQEVGQLGGTVLSLLHRHGHYQKHLSSHHKLSPLLHGAHKFNHWHNQECSRLNTTSPFTRIHWDRTTVHGILRGYFLWSSRVPNTKSKIVTGTIAASTDYLLFFSFPWRSGNVSIN